MCPAPSLLYGTFSHLPWLIQHVESVDSRRRESGKEITPSRPRSRRKKSGRVLSLRLVCRDLKTRTWVSIVALLGQSYLQLEIIQHKVNTPPVNLKALGRQLLTSG